MQSSHVFDSLPELSVTYSQLRGNLLQNLFCRMDRQEKANLHLSDVAEREFERGLD
jgi:hypothetical protein